MKVLNTVLAGLSVATLSLTAFAAQMPRELQARQQKAADVFEANMSIREQSIPQSLLNNATCIATLPNVVKAGFVFGGMGGKGVVSCRVEGGWSEPSYISLAGGNWGLQIGIESVDIVLVFMSPSAVERFSHDNFTLGGEASISAGPVGRDAQAGTDYVLKSEIYTYSKARGLYAGLTLNGTAVTVDRDANRMAYDRDITAHEILTSSVRADVGQSSVYAQALESASGQ